MIRDSRQRFNIELDRKLKDLIAKSKEIRERTTFDDDYNASIDQQYLHQLWSKSVINHDDDDEEEEVGEDDDYDNSLIMELFEAESIDQLKAISEKLLTNIKELKRAKSIDYNNNYHKSDFIH